MEFFDQILSGYFRTTTDVSRDHDWRMQTFRDGNRYADAIERLMPIKGSRVLDLACGWGGHALAFAARGADVKASDLNDHAFDKLARFAAERKLKFLVQQADCQELPFREKFDIILALDLIEHIPDPQRLAAEVRRLLAPGGVCILTTPPKALSAFWGEPHWHLKGLSLLPFSWQAPIARELFGKRYPFPIERQYWHASQIRRLFYGLECTPVPASRKVPWPSLFWGYFVIRKPVA